MITKILVSAILVITALLTRVHCRTWLHPQAFCAILGTLGILVPLLLGPAEVDSLGLAALTTLVFAQLAGTCTVTRCSGPLADQEQTPTGNLIATILLVTRLGTILAAICGFAAIISVLRIYGASFSLQALPMIAHQISLDRYMSRGQVNRPPLTQLLSIGLFTAPAFGGILYAIRSKWFDITIGFSAFLPAILNVVVQTTKASIAFALTFWLVGYFGMVLGLRVLGFDHLIRSTRPLWPVMALLPLTLGASEFLRLGTDPTMAGIEENLLTTRATVSYFGQVGAFSHWFRSYLNAPSDKSFGSITFAGPFNFVGLYHRQQGIYGESVDFNSSEGEASNIYTLYRGLIEDFGLGGALLFQFLVGCIAKIWYQRLLAGNIRAIAALSTYYSFYLFYLVSVFSYNTIVVTLVCIALFWIWLQRRLDLLLVQQ